MSICIEEAYVAKADIFDHLRVDIRFLEDFLEQGVDDKVERCVFQAAFEPFCQRRSYGEGNYYIVGILLGSVDTT